MTTPAAEPKPDTPPVDPPASRMLSRRVIGKDEATGATLIAYVASQGFTNRHGTVQGGFLAAMLDSATALTVLAELPSGRTAVTRRLEVDFEKPAYPGPLFARVMAPTIDGRRAMVEASLGNADGLVVARARAELRIVAQV